VISSLSFSFSENGGYDGGEGVCVCVCVGESRGMWVGRCMTVCLVSEIRSGQVRSGQVWA